MDIYRIIEGGVVKPTYNAVEVSVNAVSADGRQIAIGDQVYYIGKYGLTVGNVMAAKVVTRHTYSRNYLSENQRVVTRVRVTVTHTAKPQDVYAVKNVNVWVDSDRVFVV